MRILISIFYLLLFIGCNENHKAASTNKPKTADNPVVDSTSYKPGDTVLPFKDYLFSEGNWKAEIKISSDDVMDLLYILIVETYPGKGLVDKFALIPNTSLPLLVNDAETELFEPTKLPLT